MKPTPHRLLDHRNRTLERLNTGAPVFGLFLLSASSFLAEACSTLPLDWLMVDGEAGAFSKGDVLHMLQAMGGSDVTPMVRVSHLDRHTIEHALDVGAFGVLVPKVDTAEEAVDAARFCRFPPQGARGINPVRASGYFSDVPGYLAAANARTLCMVQIESAQAVENVSAIAAVPGVDVLFIGMGDLAASFGQPGVVVGERMDEACERVLAACRAHGKVPGIFAYGLDLAGRYVDQGFRFIAIGNEIKLLREGVTRSLAVLRPDSA